MHFIRKLKRDTIFNALLYSVALSNLFVLFSSQSNYLHLLIWCLLILPIFFISSFEKDMIKFGVGFFVSGTAILLYFQSIPVIFLTVAIVYFFHQRTPKVNYRSIILFVAIYTFSILMSGINGKFSNLYIIILTVLFLLFFVKITLNLYFSSISKSLTKMKYFSIGVISCSTAIFVFIYLILPFLRFCLEVVLISILKIIMKPIVAIFPTIEFDKTELKRNTAFDKLILKKNPGGQSSKSEEIFEKVTTSHIFTYSLIALAILGTVLIFYFIWKKIKQLEKKKKNKKTYTEIIHTTPHQPVKLNKYAKKINQVLNQLFVVANDIGYPKKESQSVRDWCHSVDFADTSSWLTLFENIRYSIKEEHIQDIEVFTKETKKLIVTFESKKISG